MNRETTKKRTAHDLHLSVLFLNVCSSFPKISVKGANSVKRDRQRDRQSRESKTKLTSSAHPLETPAGPDLDVLSPKAPPSPATRFGAGQSTPNPRVEQYNTVRANKNVAMNGRN